MTTLYGIKNCDTVKKARKWLEDNNIEYTFHDFRLDGLQASQIVLWAEQVDWQSLVNKRSTSWRNLDENSKQNLSRDTVVDLLLATPTLIKRPVVESGHSLIMGFNENQYKEQFLK